MPKPIIPRPFRELDLANNRWLYPTATLHFGGGTTLDPNDFGQSLEDWKWRKNPDLPLVLSVEN